MELQTLNDDFQPVSLIESYSSLVWTERYSTNGDFELKSNDVENILNRMPKESYVALRESTVPMVVEDHKIEKQPGASPLLTVTGRSFETVLERRASVKDPLPLATARALWTMPAAKESDAAYKAMRIVLGDVSRLQGITEVLSALAPAVSANDAIPEIDLTLPVDYSDTTPNTYEIKAADLYSTVMALIITNHHGIKAVRPDPDGTQVGIEIYNGADLTETVVFDVRFDQFDSSTYLLSAKASTNVAYIYGSNGGQSVLKTSAPEPSGLARRVLVLDESSDTTMTDATARGTRGLIELYNHNVTALFDGEISVQVAAGYNTNYFLGDILTLVGEYGLSETARVAEFIRTSDSSGDKSYPTFEVVDS